MQKKILRSMRILTAILLLIMVAIYIALFHFSAGEDADLGQSLCYIIPAALVAFFIGYMIAVPLASMVVKPLDSDDYSVIDYEELSPLISRIRDQRTIIRASTSELEEKERGLNTIMEHMTEGLMLLDSRGLIVSMNKSARYLLGISDGEYTGKHIFATNRDPLFQAAVHTALDGGSSEEHVNIKNSVLQVMANPVWVDNKVRGVVLLLFDITDKKEAEQMRREFSANVSHELKTPLTSISGYAEIMKNGLVKPEDYQRFSENIYCEAGRLIALIEDIIRLSRLDENSPDLHMDNVDLMDIVQDVVGSLTSLAERYEVSISVTGRSAEVFGNAQVLREMVFNLCENAIKYNKPTGSVEISVEDAAEGPVLTVKDTGIGIPPEYQSRIFERFFRVDKSHSKETGGTGLGLSIVKHGALFHKATLELDSTPGKGTIIRLKFKKAESR